MMDLNLNDKTVLITGAGGRLGQVDAELFHNEGATIVGLDIDDDSLGALRDRLDNPDSLYTVTCDLTDRSAVEDALETIRSETGGVDVLVNNAGVIDAVGKAEDFDDELWDRDMEINLTATYNITKPIFRKMCERGWGRIICMSSVAGADGGYGQLSYSTTKAGLIGFGKTLALEGAKHNVTSNILAPNIVMKEFAELSPEKLEEVNPQFEKIRQATPMGELGREEDAANLIAFLASEQARYITGQVIGVTGGVDLFTF